MVDGKLKTILLFWGMVFSSGLLSWYFNDRISA